tara:strand:+ start:474 stop:1307 length:834 start_codon:yes stop_codon:yes gene_type:complete
MNINDLKHFQNISSHKSFSLAAKMLGVTQPTLSESVRRLEKHLGVTLFYRSKSGIELTSQGKIVLDKVQGLINSVNDLESVATGSHLAQQTYRIGCHPVVGRYFLTKSLQQLYRKYQNTTINLIHSHSRDIQTQIQEGKIDIGVVVNPIKNPDLIIKPICQDKIHIWQSTNKNVRTDQLIADMGLAQVQSLLRSWGKAPAKHINTNDFNLIAELCLGGMGYAILPERFVKLEKLKLKKVVEQVHYKDEFALVYRPEFGKSELEKYIIQSINNTFWNQ